MSAFWIRENLRGKADVTALEEKLLRVNGSRPSIAFVFTQGYVIDKEIITQAIEKGASHVVYYNEAEVAYEATEFAESNDVRIWPVGSFMRAVQHGDV